MSVVWVSRHGSISGNEMLNALAENGTSRPLAPPWKSLVMSLSICKLIIAVSFTKDASLKCRYLNYCKVTRIILRLEQEKVERAYLAKTKRVAHNEDSNGSSFYVGTQRSCRYE